MKNSSHHRRSPGDSVDLAVSTDHAHVFNGIDEQAENLTLPPGFQQQGASE